jgi:hypothetical protein
MESGTAEDEEGEQQDLQAQADDNDLVAYLGCLYLAKQTSSIALDAEAEEVARHKDPCCPACGNERHGLAVHCAHNARVDHVDSRSEEDWWYE